MHKINQYNDNLNIIGTRIKEIRKEQKLSQEYLCARMQTLGYKISRSDISKKGHPFNLFKKEGVSLFINFFEKGASLLTKYSVKFVSVNFFFF